MGFLEVTAEITQARAKWAHRGEVRPAFAHPTEPGQESVWDYPRPPRIEQIDAPLKVSLDGVSIAATERGVRVLETAGAPTFYFPAQDVRESELVLTASMSLCEWKGVSRCFSIGPVRDAGWRLEEVFENFACLRGWYAFYPQRLSCFVDGERASGQPGGYYGGWVTASIAGPVKGEVGTESW